MGFANDCLVISF